jgi:hypothetical protein
MKERGRKIKRRNRKRWKRDKTLKKRTNDRKES